ncbi:MAG: diaminopimelate decarboxylase [Leptonema sp. (in: bacteria)]
MNSFEGVEYKNSILHFSGVSLLELVKQYPTPFYLYSEEILEKRINSYLEGIKNHNIKLMYSVKANSNLSILKFIYTKGLGFDIVSGGELFRCLQVKANGDRIVFSGVGKTEEEIEFALKNNILLFSVESLSELYKIQEIAHKLKVVAPVNLRVNPDIDPKTHPYISTGLKENKFGIPSNEFEEIIQIALTLKNVELLGFGYHIGSQITDINTKIEALEKSKKFINIFYKYKKLYFLDIGGGLGIQYKRDENVLSPKEFVEKLLIHIPKGEFTLLLEPGRSIVGPAGIYITKILYIKKNYNKNFYIVDGAMNELIRPSLYNAYHEILPINEDANSKQLVDVVGPICETSDFFAKNRLLPNLKENDYLAILSTGAYGFSMSSQYNSRPRPAEILIKKNKTLQIIRERENYLDLIHKEISYI